MTKTCPRCGETKSLDDFHRSRDRADGRSGHCKTCRCAARRGEYTQGGERQRAARRDRRYGLAEGQYDEMLARQDGRCAICSTAEPGGRWGLFHVDHDHETGAVRGLLCTVCNIGLGYFNDSAARLAQAAAYLTGARL